MDLGKSFTYVFEDDNWISPILIGGLLQIIPIVGQLWLVGFAVECARRAMRGDADLLPGMEDFGDRFVDGLKVFVISFLYALPTIIISVIFALLFIIPASVSSGGGEAEGFAAVAIVFFSICLIPLLIVFGILLSFLSFASMAIYIQSDSLGEALQVGRAYRLLRSKIGGFVMVWLVQILAGFVGSLGSILLGFGALFTTVYGAAMFGNYAGQFVRELGLSSSTAPRA